MALLMQRYCANSLHSPLLCESLRRMKGEPYLFEWISRWRIAGLAYPFTNLMVFTV